MKIGMEKCVRHGSILLNLLIKRTWIVNGTPLGQALSKKQPCLDELDAILSDKPTTKPHFLACSFGVTDRGSEEPESFDG